MKSMTVTQHTSHSHPIKKRYVLNHLRTWVVYKQVLYMGHTWEDTRIDDS